MLAKNLEHEDGPEPVGTSNLFFSGCFQLYLQYALLVTMGRLCGFDFL